MKHPHHLTIKNSAIHGTQAALTLRGETLADITAAMEHPPWQK